MDDEIQIKARSTRKLTRAEKDRYHREEYYAGCE